MKINILPTSLLVAGMLLAAQLKSAAQTTAATYTASANGYSASIGTTETYNAGYTHSFVGLNAKRVSGSWVVGTDAFGTPPGSGGNNGGGLLLGGIAGEFRFYSFPTLNASSTQTFTDADISSTYPQMVIGRSNGSNGGLIKPVYVKIGAMSPTGTHADYALSVDGKVVAKSVYVTSQNWADFVFEPTYKRLSLPALEQYLQANKHLPNIPAAKEVEANGYGLAEMDAKLLQSVEELTLHVIELNKRNSELNARNERIEAELAALRKQMIQKTGGAKK